MKLVLQNLTADQCLKILPTLKERNGDFHHVTECNMNALHIVCQRQHVSQYLEVLHYLVAIVVDPTQERIDGAVPLMFALQMRHGNRLH